MKIAVVGSRTFNNYELLEKTLTDYLFLNVDTETFYNNAYNTIIISGGAKGADTLAERFAEEKGLEKLIFPAMWRKNGYYNPYAGYARNHDIIKNADVVFAFWDGKSRGTQHSIDLAKHINKELYVIEEK